MATPKKITLTMGDKDEKKKVVRYNGDEDAPIANVYISKEALKALGDPDEVKITVEAA